MADRKKILIVHASAGHGHEKAARAVEEAGGTCHVVVGEVPESLLDELVSDHDAWDASVSAEPEARELAHRLAARGVQIHEATPEATAEVTLGVTTADDQVTIYETTFEEARNQGAIVGNPWDEKALANLDPNADMLVLGTGLTMVDTVISLLDRGHKGRIVAVSRRGLLPRLHLSAVK